MKQFIVKVSNKKADFFEEMCKQLSIECTPYKNNDTHTSPRTVNFEGLKKALDAIEDQRKKL